MNPKLLISRLNFWINVSMPLKHFMAGQARAKKCEAHLFFYSGASQLIFVDFTHVLRGQQNVLQLRWPLCPRQG